MKNMENFAAVLADAEPVSIARLLAATSDIALVVGAGGIISTVAAPGNMSSRLDMNTWQGSRFSEIVTPDTREIADRLLLSARASGQSEPRELAHGAADGDRIELRYVAASLGENRPMVLVGRTLSPAGEGRIANPYGPLFEFGAQPALVVDARTGAILEAGGPAAECLRVPLARLRDANLFDLVALPWRREANSRLRGVMASGRPDRFAAEIGPAGTKHIVAIDRLAAGTDAALLLVRFLAFGDDAHAQVPGLTELVGSIPECMVLLDEDCRIRWANDAFLAEVGLAETGQASGRPLDDFVVTAENADLEASFARARQGGQTQRLRVTIAGQVAARESELSIAWLPNASPKGFGAVIANAAKGERLLAMAGPDGAALLDLVGSVPLKDMVRDTTDAVEKLCIEAALRLTGDNRAAAARVLGLSRQALYLKLERYGLG